MPLPFIQYDSAGLQRWMFDHWQDHIEIINGVQRILGTKLAMYPIYPFTPESPDTWVQAHLQMHFDMNNALGLSGDDISSVDFSHPDDVAAFIDVNFLEHSNVRFALGI